MINLIKNELFKILKKKSTYIILIITLGMVILSNFLYKNMDTDFFNGYSSDSLSFYEESLESLDPSDASTLSTYIDCKNQVDSLRLMKKYGFNSWQAHIIPEYLSPYINTMNVNTYLAQKDEQVYNEAKAEYNKLIEKLEKGDWRYFANEELNEVNSQIEAYTTQKKETTDKKELSSIDDTLYSLDLEKQVLQWRLDKDISYASSFLNNCLENYYNSGNSIYSYEKSDNHSYSEKQEYYQYLSDFNIYRYYIENNIRNIESYDNRGILLNLFSEYELFILIFIVMIAGSIVSDEFSKGTIKLLLVRPYNRIKILLSKFIVCIIVLVLFIALVAVAQFILGGFIQGFDSLSTPAVIYDYNTQQVETLNIAQFICITAIAKLPMYLLLMTLAFTCSTVFTNTAVSIVLPLLGYMGSSIINLLALNFDIKFLLYFVTPNWDFTNYLFGGLPEFESLTVPFSLAICAIYFAIMMIMSFVMFKKRNIKNV